MADPIKPELYNLTDVCAVLRIGRTTVYNLIEHDPSFPRQVRVTSRAVRWRRTEIEQWARRRPEIKRARSIGLADVRPRNHEPQDNQIADHFFASNGETRDEQ